MVEYGLLIYSMPRADLNTLAMRAGVRIPMALSKYQIVVSVVDEMNKLLPERRTEQ
jgi:hypothetical protein